MKDRPVQSPINYSPNIAMGIKPNVLSQLVGAIQADVKREHCAHKAMNGNPFAPVHLSKDGK